MEMVKLAAMSTNRISSDLHHLVMDIRMVPIKETFLRFRRLVRDIAKKRGRQVDFEIVGEDTLVDKTVAERLYEPLAHQIRNAIDHGLEDPLERQHAGKPPPATSPSPPTRRKASPSSRSRTTARAWTRISSARSRSKRATYSPAPPCPAMNPSR
jgi:hypothetical protein